MKENYRLYLEKYGALGVNLYVLSEAICLVD